mgnify:CR=1 FL=1
MLKQLMGVIMGLVIMVILSLIDYSWISNFQWIMYGGNIVLLLIVRLFGDTANGAARWIDFGFIRFQPTELAKIIIILFFARFFMDHEEDLNSFRTLAKSAVLLAVPLYLILDQPDLKNTIMITVVFCVLIYIAGLSYRIIGGALLIAVPLLVIFLMIVVQPEQKLIKDYQRDRIMAFLYPENEEYTDDTQQQDNSKTAIASGELTGKRLSGDSVASVNERNLCGTRTRLIYLCSSRGGIRFYRMYYHYPASSGYCSGMYPYGTSGKGSVRKNHLLRNGKYRCFPELSEYLRSHRNGAEYRNASSLCKLWTDLSYQSL